MSYGRPAYAKLEETELDDEGKEEEGEEDEVDVVASEWLNP